MSNRLYFYYILSCSDVNLGFKKQGWGFNKFWPDPYLTCNNGYVKLFSSGTKNLNQNQEVQASTNYFHPGKFLNNRYIIFFVSVRMKVGVVFLSWSGSGEKELGSSPLYNNSPLITGFTHNEKIEKGHFAKYTPVILGNVLKKSTNLPLINMLNASSLIPRGTVRVLAFRSRA